MTSPYITEAAAQTRSEAECRSRATIQAAIPPGKTYDEALLRATNYARQAWDDVFAGSEDEKLAELQGFCVRLCRDNQEAGKLLATEALWNM